MSTNAKPRQFAESEVEFDIRIEPDEIPVEDWFSEPEDVKWVYSQLDAGNDYAWFFVAVTARVDGINLKGRDSLGACSYQSQADFEANLLPELKANALADLNAEIANHVKKLAL